MVDSYSISLPSAYLEKEEVWILINSVTYVSRHPERDKLLLRTLWETGGRISEVLELIPSRIDEKQSALILKNLKQKKRSSWKKVYISANLINALLLFCKKNRVGRDDWVFKANRNPTKHLSRNYAWWIINKTADESNILKFSKKYEKRKPAWPHLFRHGCAMFILDETGKTEKVQRQLGHSSIVTTQAYAVLKLHETDREISDLPWEEK